MAALDPRLDRLAASVAGRSTAGVGGLSFARTRTVAKRGRQMRVQVLIELDDASARVELDGVIVNGAGRRFRTAYLPVSQLPALSAHQNVARVVPSTLFELSLDEAARLAGFAGHASAFTAGSDGALIGIIDSGIDGSHPGFGRRIEVVWDQTQHGHGTDEFGYGRLFHKPHEVCPSDAIGHGTFVASIAAGQRASNLTWTGVNPAARLAVVKCGMHDGEILDAAHFLADFAERRGLPLVLNLSLGAHGGPHDGSGPLSLGLDDLAGPGRIVCCAAGNEAVAQRHASVTFDETPGSTVELGVILGPFERPVSLGKAELLIWLRGDVRGLELQIEGPDDTGTTPWVGPLRDDPQRNLDLEAASVSLHMPLDAGDEHRFVCEINSRGAPLEGWKVRLRRSSRLDSADIWSVPDTHFGPATLLGPYVDPLGTVGAPGDARGAITVGSWCSRTRVPAPEFERPGIVGEVSDFSSRGPLRDGRDKPDLVAPGTWLVAARSSAAPIVEDDIVPGRTYCVGRGTSAATAFVTGVVSLMLAENPGLGPDDVRERLRNAVRQRPSDGGPEWGAGLVGPEGQPPP